MPLNRLTLRVYLLGVTQMVLTLLISLALYRALGPPRDAPFRGPAHLARFFVSSVMVHPEDPARMRQDAERLRQLLGVRMSIYGADGALVLSSHAPPLPPLAEGERARLGRQEGVFLGERHMLAIPLAEGNPAGGYAIVEVPPPPRRSGLPPVPPQQMFWRLQYLGFALGLLSLLVLSILFGRELARPLSRLTAVAQALGRGDLSVRSGFQRRDAFGVLGAAFDQMADRVALLLRSQKELLGNVSHELRTPLSRIRVALDIAAESDAEGQRAALAEVGTDLDELERLVDDVLTAVRLDLTAEQVGAAPPLHKELVEPARLLEQCAARLRAAHPGRAITLEVEAALPPLAADPVLLRRALDNLLDNARKYSEADSAITLRAARRGARLVLEVADQGMGIEAADVPLLGTPFFRTDRSRARRTGGVGLGLVLVRQIVGAHGGALEIESRVGAGTTVRICLPLPAPAEDDRSRPPAGA